MITMHVEKGLEKSFQIEGFLVDNDLNIQVIKFQPKLNTFLIAVSFTNGYRYCGVLSSEGHTYLLFSNSGSSEDITLKLKITGFDGHIIADPEKRIFHAVLVDPQEYSRMVSAKELILAHTN